MSCYFSACCIASGEPAQIYGSISKMEIQRMLWTSRYEKRALTVAFVHITCDFPGVRTLYPPYGSARKQRGSNTDRNRGLNMQTD